MNVPRASAALGRTALRRASAQARSRAWRQLGRRGYASEHGKQSSEIPWMIGSVAFTVPAAVWLMGQAPKKEAHHAAENEEVKEVSQTQDKDEEQPAEEESEDKSDEKSDEGSDDEKKGDDKDEKAESGGDSGSEDSKEESSDEKSDESSDDEKESKGSGKGPGEGQKGPRRAPEKKGEKDASSDKSGAQNPYLDDDEKSKKGEGVKETAKIHGTVDSNREARGDGKE